MPRRWVFRLFLLFIVLPVTALSLWIWAALHWSYSTGERAGYVQKISKKGWLCKTWEGELAMANLPGTMPQIFTFSVRDDAIAKDITRTVGQRVSLTYEQHKGLPTACWGETEYFVTHVMVAPMGEGAKVAPSSPTTPSPTPR